MILTDKQKIRLEVTKCLMLAGKNQRELADYIGMDKSYISRFLNSDSPIRADNSFLPKAKEAFENWGVNFDIEI